MGLGIRDARLVNALHKADLITRVERLEKIIGSSAMRAIDELHPLHEDEDDEAKTPEGMADEIEGERTGTIEGVSADDVAAADPEPDKLDEDDAAAVAALGGSAGKLEHKGFGRFIVTVDNEKVWPPEDRWGTKTDAQAFMQA